MERAKDIADLISQSSVPPSAHSAARPISKPLQLREKWMSGSRPALVLCRNKFQAGLEIFSHPGACPQTGTAKFTQRHVQICGLASFPPMRG